jgi:hypothetical protein
MHAHRPLPSDSDPARAIAVLARVQQDAVWNRQQVVNQVRSLLREYYPAALDAFLGKQHGLPRAEACAVLATAPTPARAARLHLTQLRSALKRAGRHRGIDAEAERLRHAGAQRHLFNRMIGQLYHCLQSRQLFDEQHAFPSGPSMALATAA